MITRKTIATIAVLGMAGILIAQGVVRLQATMRNGAMKGKVNYKLSTRVGRQIQEELSYEGEKLAPNTEYTLTLNGVAVGTATTDGFGAFQWDKRNIGQQRYSVSVGSTATIENANGVALSGAFIVR